MPFTAPAKAKLQFPVRCPECGALAGFPRGVSAAGGGPMKVDMRCTSCEKIWIDVRALPEPKRTAS